ncbi:MAG: acetyl-CoA carboxylase biotin carboxyl carrier protein subunit, partial [Desulfobacterales bacterium]
PKAAAPAPKAAPAAAVDGTALTAPMPGMIVRYAKEVGDSVDKGETVVILEAMKMENALPAPAAGTIKAINFATGDSVAKDAVLCVIG